MTFEELGAPFPLFEGPVDEASEFVGTAKCEVCSVYSEICFALAIGCALIISCPICQTENGIDCCERKDEKCRSCGNRISFPPVDATINICYRCLRQGHGAISKDTKLGMVSWEQAFSGLTHGVPGLRHNDFDLVQVDGTDWYAAKVPKEMLFELVRTPSYSTIQGEQWEFCCKHPMIYIGRWTKDDFNLNAPQGNGKAYFDQIVQHATDGLWNDELHDVTGIYVFRCAVCNRKTANWDIA